MPHTTTTKKTRTTKTNMPHILTITLHDIGVQNRINKKCGSQVKIDTTIRIQHTQYTLTAIVTQKGSAKYEDNGCEIALNHYGQWAKYTNTKRYNTTLREIQKTKTGDENAN